MINTFEQYDSDNPEVFRLFRQYAEQALGRGFRRFSAKAIFERLRWHYTVETSGDEFKLNNNYTAHYARKLIAEDPRFEGFFELRKHKGDQCQPSTT